MEEMIKLLKCEIKRIASEENINVNKLNAYTQIYERLKLFEVTSVQDMVYNMNMAGYDHPVRVGYAPRLPNDLENIMDILKEVILTMNKSKRDDISEYIFWVRFLKDMKEDIDSERLQITEDLDNLITNVFIRTTHLMKKKLDDDIAGKTEENTTSTFIDFPEA